MSDLGARIQALRLARDPRFGLALCCVIAAAGALGLYESGLEQRPAMMAGVAVLMALCWVLEVVPIPVTSLFPLVLFPLFGVAKIDVVASNYGKSVIFLFLGGFLLAFGLQRSRLHRRIALNIINALGSRPSQLHRALESVRTALVTWHT